MGFLVMQCSCTHFFRVKWSLQRYTNGATKVHRPDYGQDYPFGECELHSDGVPVSSRAWRKLSFRSVRRSMICGEDRPPKIVSLSWHDNNNIVFSVMTMSLQRMDRALETTNRFVKNKTHTRGHANGLKFKYYDYIIGTI